MRRRVERALELALDGGVEAVHAAHDAERDVVVEQRLQLAPQVLLQERHERRDLEARPLPVLGREGVERQRRQLEARGRLDGRPHGRDPRAVAFHARQAPLARPAAVAVHDDGHVPGQPPEVEPVEQGAVGCTGGGDGVLVDHRAGRERARTMNSIPQAPQARRAPAERLRGIEDPREREAAGLGRRPRPRGGLLGADPAPPRVAERAHEAAHHARAGTRRRPP